MSRSDAFSSTQILVTCEHAGNRIPLRYRELFEGAEAALRSHRGYDIGALPLARRLSRRLGAPLQAARISRLLVDLNRSPESPEVFSEFTATLDPEAREELLARYHAPYREGVRAEVAHVLETAGRFLHLSVHSFTPVWEGSVRGMDVGLLYDPTRDAEARLAAGWEAGILREEPAITVRHNEPYAGTGDGLAASLRSRFAGERYVGVEVEVNQKHLTGRSPRVPDVAGAVVAGAAATFLADGSR